MKRILSLFATIALALLVFSGCQKEAVDGLQGKWKPVYIFGTGELGGYIVSCDSPVDEHGNAKEVLVGKERPDVVYEENILVPGIRFFRQKGEDVFITFFMDSPKEYIGKPLKYMIREGKIYHELPMGAFINCDPSLLDEGSGEFDEGSPLVYLDNGQIQIGGITYSRL